VAIAADVTDREAMVAAAEQTSTALGRAEALINNAGVMLLGPFGTEQREEARRSRGQPARGNDRDRGVSTSAA